MEWDEIPEEGFDWYQNLLGMMFAPGYILFCALIYVLEGYNYIAYSFVLINPMTKPLDFILCAVIIGLTQFFLLMFIDWKLTRFKVNKKFSQIPPPEGTIIGS